jgi:DNA-binding NarL/FixJ family response regulator
MVVEDFEPFRRMISSILQNRAEVQVVCEVSDGLEAVQKAKELQPDLILLDIALPGLNGIEAARQISNLVPQSKILFLAKLLLPMWYRKLLAQVRWATRLRRTYKASY